MNKSTRAFELETPQAIRVEDLRTFNITEICPFVVSEFATLKEDVMNSGSVGFCGVCCSHCGMQTRVPKMASDLKRFVEGYRYGEWIGYVTQDFDFKNFLNGLGWFSRSGCKGCLNGGGMLNCEVRTCCRRKGLDNCYLCEDFLKCAKLAYQKETYKIEENYVRIKQVGYDRWLKEQESKSKENFDNIHYLEEK